MCYRLLVSYFHAYAWVHACSITRMSTSRTSLELIENKTELLLKPCTIIILFKNKNLIIGILLKVFRIQTSINNPKF